MPSRRVFISYHDGEPDKALARSLREVVTAAGHYCFMAAESLKLGDEWPQRIDQELDQCDFFLLILSARSAASDMVIEEVRRARHLHKTRPEKKPRILPVRVCLDADAGIDYDLGSYLNRFQRIDWRSESDTEEVSNQIMNVIGSPAAPINSYAKSVTAKSRKRVPALSVSLQQACVRALIQCRELTDKSTLEPLFGIEPLAKYATALPLEARSRVQMIEVIVHNLLTYPAMNGQPLLDLLTVLRDKRDEQDLQRKELDELLESVRHYVNDLAG
jgi:TIR domain